MLLRAVRSEIAGLEDEKDDGRLGALGGMGQPSPARLGAPNVLLPESPMTTGGRLLFSPAKQSALGLSPRSGASDGSALMSSYDGCFEVYPSPGPSDLMIGSIWKEQSAETKARDASKVRPPRGAPRASAPRHPPPRHRSPRRARRCR